jgi:ferredoxin-NADP reductase
MSNFNQESVLSVHHWTDTLFSFTTTRDPSFRFRNGVHDDRLEGRRAAVAAGL